MADAPTEQPRAQAHGQTHIGCTVPTDLYRLVKGILGTQGRTLRDVVIQALRQVVEDEQRTQGETSWLTPQEPSSPRVYPLEHSVPFVESTSRVPGATLPGRDSLTLVAGGTVRLPVSQHRVVPFPYLHWCVRCNEVFTSKEADPERCGKCKNLYWRGDFLHDVRRHRAKPREESASA